MREVLKLPINDLFWKQIRLIWTLLLCLSHIVIKLAENLLELDKISQKIEEKNQNRWNRWEINKIDEMDKTDKISKKQNQKQS